MIKISIKRGKNLNVYLQNAGYDANIISEFSIKHNHRPIIDINPKNSKALKEKIQLIKDEKKKFKFFNRIHPINPTNQPT